LESAVALTVIDADVTFTSPAGFVDPAPELLTVSAHAKGCGFVALVKKALNVWFDPPACCGMIIVEVVLVDVTLYIVMLAVDVKFKLSNCQ
jgi:hypothetical protein